ncbi:MAG: DUF445 domain-containing protein [Peptococcales bacterium]|jgi:uncharacterized membrane protein YheB (UPF0754 family)
MGIYLLVSSFVGALIGWSTNVIAIKLIFRPYKPFDFFGLFTIQGLIPKRRAELAKVIGEIVEKELLSSSELITQLSTSSDVQEKLVKSIFLSINNRLLKYFPPFLPSALKENILLIIDGVIRGEVVGFFQETLPKLTTDLKDTIPVAIMVENKINQLNLAQLENLILAIAKKELKHIEYLGGILGLIIGLIQGVLLRVLT